MPPISLLDTWNLIFPMQASSSLIDELETAFTQSSSAKRVDTLRRVTDLFLDGADRFSDAQIGLFDDVLCHLVKRIEHKALAELSGHLAPVDNAPIELVRRLARDDELAVAGPVLTQSKRLTAEDLVDIAATKSQGHLLAISERGELAEVVTDVLVARGESQVAHRLAINPGARFSDVGFTTLVQKAETDESLAEKVGSRIDIPIRLLRELLLKATESVRTRLFSVAPPETKGEIQRALAKISTEVSKETMAPRDFTQAKQTVLSMQQRGKLTEAAVLEFAKAQKYEETVAALAALCSCSVDIIAPLMRSDRNEGLIMACRAAGLKWLTVSEILRGRVAHHAISDDELNLAKINFLKLTKASAQRTLRFWQIRVTAGR